LALLYVPDLTFQTQIKFSSGSFSPGQKIYVIGSPLGLPATISEGIISGLRDFNGHHLIQITAPISSGSSGGPVLNDKGELVGVAVAQFKDGQNLNFAIPKNHVELLLSFASASVNEFSENTKKNNEQKQKESEKVSLYKKGFEAFKAHEYSIAIDIFEKYKEKYPDEIHGYYWCFRSKSVLDIDMSKGLAIQDALGFIEVAEKDKVKNKATLIVAYGYMAGYVANLKSDYQVAIQWLDKIIAIDSNNFDANNNKEILKKAILRGKK
jgi:tetratricopeptide (TPR) repeat protein